MAALIALVCACAMANPTSALAVGGDQFDTGFGTDGVSSVSIGAGASFVKDVAIQPDGKMIVAGWGFRRVACPASTTNGLAYFVVVRLNEDGSLDTTFGTNGEVVLPFAEGSAYATDIGLQPDGGIVLAGYVDLQDSPCVFRSPNTRAAVVRLTQDGVLDPSFGDSGRVLSAANGWPTRFRNTSVLIQPDGGMIVGGSSSISPTTGSLLMRLTASGAEDPNFAVPIFDNPGRVGDLVAVDGGSFLVFHSRGFQDPGFQCLNPFGCTVFAITRYLHDGNVDSTFGRNGTVERPFISPSGAVGNADPLVGAVDSEGRILIGGINNGQYAIARYGANGAVDSSFGTSGLVVGNLPLSTYNVDLAVRDDSGIVVVGTRNATFRTGIFVRVLSSEGQPDDAFGPNGEVMISNPDLTYDAQAVAVRTDGRAVLGGSVYDGGDSSTARLFFAAANTGPLPNQLPETPSLISPAQGATLTDTRVTFRWAAADRADTYDLVVDGEVVASDITGTDETQTLSPREHSWQVIAKNSVGIARSQERQFTIQRIRFFALGDSVTAGFGMDSLGEVLPLGVLFVPGPPFAINDPRTSGIDVIHCIGPIDFRVSVKIKGKVIHYPGVYAEKTMPAGSCQSPYKAAYPAAYARMQGLDSSEFRNFATWGSTPQQWWESREPGGLREKLDQVASDNPTLTVLTLGANPGLEKFIFGDASGCYWSAIIGVLLGGKDKDKKREKGLAKCASNELDEKRGKDKQPSVAEYLRRIYTKLLYPTFPDEQIERKVRPPANLLGNNHVAIFEYHATRPIMLGGTTLLELTYGSIQIVLGELNRRVNEAARIVQGYLPVGKKDRLKILSPDNGGGRFLDHGCFAGSQAWVLVTDTCIHPNALGHEQFAKSLNRTYPDLESLVDDR